MTTKSISRVRRLAVASTVIIALMSTVLYTVPHYADAATKPIDTMQNGVQYGPPSFADLAEKVRPAVVSIVVTGKTEVSANMPQFQAPQFPEGSPFGEFFKHFQFGMPNGGNGMEREFKAAGSGFIITEDGYVVTNNHVVDHASEIKIITNDGTKYDATLKGRDSKTDLALVKIKSDKTFPYVKLGDSDHARVGEWVVAVGNPFGLGGSVTAGIISARGRDIQSGPFDDFIQVDAPINKGNSGGPLFDSQGRVIGVNTAIYSPSGGNVGIAFAIPSNLAKQVVADLETKGKVVRGWLGVQIQPITAEIADSLGLKDDHGALVAAVEPDSPAQHGGVKPGDVILSLNGQKLDNFKDLSKLVAGTPVGSESTLKVERQGQMHELQIQIGTMPNDDVKLALANDNNQTPSDETPKIGVYLAELTPEARQQFHINKDINGVLVAGVQPGSPAAKAGIQPGNVISMVGQETVKSPEDVINQVKHVASEKKSSVLLMVEHDGVQQFVAVKFAKA
ncbi:MAG: DegQ family serine endoprotease [Gammaproteobacteria bacterium]